MGNRQSSQSADNTLNMSILKRINQFSDHLLEQTNCANKSMPIKLTNAEGTQLQQLNEDCLLQIFSVESLDLMDLCSLVEACAWFRPIIQRIILKAIRIHVRNTRTFDVELGKYWMGTRKTVTRIFRNFGSSLSAVKIEGLDRGEFLLELIAKHCNDDNLKSLTLHMHQILIPDVLAVKLKPIFMGLLKVDLEYAEMVDDAFLYGKLVSLVEFRVAYVKNCGAILENFFPKLQRFEYKKEKIVMADSIQIDSEDQQTFGNLSSFVARHQTLNVLKLFFRCNDSCRTTILQLIANHCKELKELHLFLGLGTVASSLRPLRKLKSLRALGLRQFSLEDLQFFSTLTELRELSLRSCHLPEDSDQYACLTQLTKLKFDHISSTGLVDIIARLTNLEVLEYLDTLDEETYCKILPIVRGRPKVLTLKCFFWFNVNNYVDNQNVRLLKNCLHGCDAKSRVTAPQMTREKFASFNNY